MASSNESQQSILTTVQQEMAQRRKQKTNGTAVIVKTNGTNGTVVAPVPFMTRQDSRLSVKSLIESIENTSKQSKSGSQSGSTTSLNSLTAMDQQQNDDVLQFRCSRVECSWDVGLRDEILGMKIFYRLSMKSKKIFNNSQEFPF